MNFRFHRDAEREPYAAIEYYEGCNKGLGYDLQSKFIRSLNASQLIQKRGLFWKVTSGDA